MNRFKIALIQDFWELGQVGQLSNKTNEPPRITIYLVKIIRFIELPVKASTLKIVSTIFYKR